jgi:pimeloyl-ACP methyl ester carboxylesterase
MRAELASLRVPESRHDLRARILDLPVLRFRSDARRPGPPLIYLAGGPGASAIEQATGAWQPMFQRLSETADVIVLQQRGTTLFGSPMPCGTRIDYRMDVPLAVASLTERCVARCHDCAAHWRAGGADVSGYNVAESADDVHALCEALSAERVSLFGVSYGTRLALETVRRHAERIDRVILAAVQGPDHTYRLPGQVQRSLEEVARVYRAHPDVSDVLPDLIEFVEGRLGELAERPVRARAVDPVTGSAVTVTMGDVDLRSLLASMSGSRERIARFPSIAAAFRRGDFSPLARRSMSVRRQPIPSVMPFLVNCASGVSDARAARIQDEAPRTLAGNLLNVPYPEVCRTIGARDLGPSFRALVRADLPALFISGTLDGRTPPENAEEVRLGFSHSSHLVVEGAGHADHCMFNNDTIRLMVDFLERALRGAAGSTVPPDTRLVAPPITFA